MNSLYSLFITRIPNLSKTSNVKSIYDLDSNGEVTLIIESPFKSGNAKSRPLINCEDTFPGISNTSGYNCPLIYKSKTSSLYK